MGASLPPGFILKDKLASPDLLDAVEMQESGGNQNAVSPKGAFGVMQLMPDTARDPGFGVKPLDPNAADQEAENRRVGTDYLNAMLRRYNGDTEAALVAYNWGPGNADKWVAGGKRGKLPAETSNYVRTILAGVSSHAPNVTDQPKSTYPLDIEGEQAKGRQVAAMEPMRLAPPDESGKKLPPGFILKKRTAPASTPALATPPAPAADFRLENQWAPPVPVTAGGLVKAGASGLQQGIAGLLGLPGDVRQLATKLGVPENMPLGPMVPFGAPTSAQVQGAYEKAGGPVHQPQNTAEEYVGTFGMFLPNLLGGGAPAVAKTGLKAGLQAATRRGAQVAVPAALSETGGQIGRKISPEAETGLRTAGALFGGVKTGQGKLRTTDDIRDLSQTAYKEAEAAGLRIKGKSFRQMVGDLDTGPDPQLFPRLAHAAGEIKKMVPGAKRDYTRPMTRTKDADPGAISLEQFDNARRTLLTAARSPDANERRIAGELLDRMDDFFDNLSPKDIAAGNHQQAQKALRDARSLWRRYRKSEEIDTIIELAKTREGQFTVSGPANSIKTEFRQLSRKIIKDKRVANRYTAAERKAIHKLGRGVDMVNALGVLSKLSPRGALALAGGVAASAADVFNPGGGWAVGEAARMLGGSISKNRARKLQDLVRGRASPSAPGVAPMSGIAATSPDRLEER